MVCAIIVMKVFRIFFLLSFVCSDLESPQLCSLTFGELKLIQILCHSSHWKMTSISSPLETEIALRFAEQVNGAGFPLFNFREWVLRGLQLSFHCMNNLFLKPSHHGVMKLKQPYGEDHIEENWDTLPTVPTALQTFILLREASLDLPSSLAPQPKPSEAGKNTCASHRIIKK